MADRRSDDTPLAPRRSLGGPAQGADSSGETTARRPLSDRVSAAIATASNALPTASESKSSGRSGSAPAGRTGERSGGARAAPGTASTAASPALTLARGRVRKAGSG
jgi:hypothetical protein